MVQIAIILNCCLAMPDVCYKCTYVLSVYMYNQFALLFILPEANSQGRYG